jgi:hypothetical protein
MASCGANALPRFREVARITQVSEQSYQENFASVMLRDPADQS